MIVRSVAHALPRSAVREARAFRCLQPLHDFPDGLSSAPSLMILPQLGGLLKTDARRFFRANFSNLKTFR